MKNRIDNILLALLWLLAAILGACFWFNVRFGFDLFSGKHWAYLAQLQATNNSVDVYFYISLIISVFITLLGLYLIIKPKFRKINFRNSSANLQGTKNEAHQNNEKNLYTAAESTYGEIRPPKLNLPKQTFQKIESSQSQPLTFFKQQENILIDNNKIENIFKDLGYTIKKTPTISGVKMILFAIAPNEVVWIGSTNISISDMKQAVTELNKLFVDSLEELPININSFIINPINQVDNNNDIFTFNSTEELEAFIKTKPATPIPTDKDELETFNAFSEYINVVIDFINRG